MKELLNELEIYITALKKTNNKNYTDYKEIQKDLKKEFDLEVSIEDILQIYEPTIEEDQQDLELIYKNIL